MTEEYEKIPGKGEKGKERILVSDGYQDYRKECGKDSESGEKTLEARK